MRLLHFSRTFTGHDRRFLEAYARNGIEAGFVSLEPASAGPEAAGIAGVRLLGALGAPPQVSTAQLREAIQPLASIVREFRPDVVVAGPVHDCAYLATEAVSGCAVVAQSWAFDVLWENRLDREVALRTQEALRRTDSLFADCSAVLKTCEEIAGSAFRRSFVMPWGVEAGPSTAETRRSPAPRKGKVFLHTRGLEPVYAVDVLMKAFAGLLKAVPDATLLLASEGSLRPWVEAFIGENQLHGSVRLLGALPHARLLDLYGEADVFVSCAASDGTSISLLEAMRSGLPPIVNDRGGNREWVADGINGWVVPFGDVERLTKAMAEAASCPAAALEAITGHGREIVRARADWETNFPRYLHFLEGCRA